MLGMVREGAWRSRPPRWRRSQRSSTVSAVKPREPPVRRLHGAAQEGFRALCEAELRLPPGEAVEAARGHLVDLAEDVAMGAWLGSVDAARDDLIAAADRLIAAQKAFHLAAGGD